MSVCAPASSKRPTQIWLAVFAIWAFLLTGALSSVVGSPGVVQALRLRALLQTKQERLAQVEAEIARLEAEIGRLEKSKVAQEKEIRRTLGYASEDEIIFDFSAADRRTVASR